MTEPLNMGEDATSRPGTQSTQRTDHGGRAGWFRVAGGFSALAAVNVAVQAWHVARVPSAANIPHPWQLVLALGLGVAGFACASVFAVRERASAGAWLVLSYVVVAVALYVLTGVVAPPGLLLVACMIALIIATRRPERSTGPAA